MVPQLEPMLAFWQREAGLAFEQLLPTGGSNQQHRHAMNGSVLKLNASRNPQPDTPPAGDRELWIARAGERELRDPDENRVRLVAPGERGVARFSMVRDPDGNWIELSQRGSLTGPLPGNAAS